MPRLYSQMSYLGRNQCHLPLVVFWALPSLSHRLSHSPLARAIAIQRPLMRQQLRPAPRWPHSRWRHTRFVQAPTRSQSLTPNPAQICRFKPKTARSLPKERPMNRAHSWPVILKLACTKSPIPTCRLPAQKSWFMTPHSFPSKVSIPNKNSQPRASDI